MRAQAEKREQPRVTRRRFTVHEYHRMAEAGILHEDDRVDLIEGEIVGMNQIGSRHATCVRALDQLLNRQVGDDLLVGVQNPITLDEYEEPPPHPAVIRPGDHRERCPDPRTCCS